MKLRIPSTIRKFFSAAISVLSCGLVMPSHAATEQRQAQSRSMLSLGIDWVIFQKAAQETAATPETRAILEQAEQSPTYSAALQRLNDRLCTIHEKAETLRHA